MYAKVDYDDIIEENRNKNLKEINIGNNKLLCNKMGIIYRKMKSGNWKEIENKENHKKGYNVILIDKKQYTRAKLVLYAYGGINLYDKNINICHINKDKLDCGIDNLKIR